MHEFGARKGCTRMRAPPEFEKSNVEDKTEEFVVDEELVAVG